MSFEVEMKFRVADPDELLRRVVALGATAEPSLEQEDAYLSHPARDFGQTNEALRIRRVGDWNAVTYKGPRQPGPTKTREEIEIPFLGEPGGYASMLRLFENLGFLPVAVVRKVRRPFHLNVGERLIEVVIDEVEGSGTFAEVETIAGTEAELSEAQAAVLDVAGRLGLSEVEPRSYLSMLLERQRRTER